MEGAAGDVAAAVAAVAGGLAVVSWAGRPPLSPSLPSLPAQGILEAVVVASVGIGIVTEWLRRHQAESTKTAAAAAAVGIVLLTEASSETREECRFLCPPYARLGLGVCVVSPQGVCVNREALVEFRAPLEAVISATVYAETGFIRLDTDTGKVFVRGQTQEAADRISEGLASVGVPVRGAATREDFASERALLSAVCRGLGFVEESEQLAAEARAALAGVPRAGAHKHGVVMSAKKGGGWFGKTDAEKVEEKLAVCGFSEAMRMAAQWQRCGGSERALRFMTTALNAAVGSGVPPTHPAVSATAKDAAWLLYEQRRLVAALNLLHAYHQDEEAQQMGDWRERVSRLLERASELSTSVAIHGPVAALRQTQPRSLDSLRGCATDAEAQRLQCMEHALTELDAALGQPDAAHQDPELFGIAVAVRSTCAAQLPVLRTAVVR
eukprot:Hpha_TRINITY_DN6972_c0_g2::TRINITY_DN6972_c0_g2_i1::g.139495::m.139495